MTIEERTKISGDLMSLSNVLQHFGYSYEAYELVEAAKRVAKDGDHNARRKEVVI
jgi:hypothetical protein